MAASALGALLALSGCATPTPKAPNPTFAATPRNPLEQYEPSTHLVETRLALAEHPKGALSPAQRTALTTLMRNASDAGDAVIELRYPANEPETADGMATARAAADFLAQSGTPVSRLMIGRYTAEAGPAAILVTYRATEALAPDCNKGWNNVTSTMSNSVTQHFGCAQAANLAAMIADPRDLERPAPDTPADATRRGVILGKYRKGDQTASAKDEQASGAVSQAVK
jgi:pilus assembly protein CpaD